MKVRPSVKKICE
ncbi:MAG: 50S ribosomal protein L36, partial [Phascolarctobacterium sp.]|nr:50S ribosomal protein L36 [Phascolarctobacterium sp.]